MPENKNNRDNRGSKEYYELLDYVSKNVPDRTQLLGVSGYQGKWKLPCGAIVIMHYKEI